MSLILSPETKGGRAGDTAVLQVLGFPLFPADIQTEPIDFEPDYYIWFGYQDEWEPRKSLRRLTNGTGPLEPDDEAVYHWEQEHLDGDFDTPENQAEHPWSFFYQCCGGDGSSRGCRQGRHTANGHEARRMLGLA